MRGRVWDGKSSAMEVAERRGEYDRRPAREESEDDAYDRWRDDHPDEHDEMFQR